MNEDVVFVLKVHGRVEGFGHLSIGRGENQAEAEVVGLYFSPNGRGLGAGRTMLQRLERIAKENSVSRIVLDSTHTSVMFYQKCGYQKLGEKVVQVRGVNIELVPMHKLI